MPNYLRYYIPNSMVFITIVTEKRKPILIKNIDLLRKSIKNVNKSFKIIAGCVLPEHIHIIIQPENINDFSKIVFSIKYAFSKYLPKDDELCESKIKRKEKGIWQRRFYDHIIRDDNDLNRHLDYIHYNPVKHGYVNAPKDWAYSSFKKFVEKNLYDKNWCNLSDKITQMNIE